MELPKILIIPLIAGMLAQLAKVVVEAARTGSIDLRILNTYGGMPSSHTALVTSLSATVGIVEGLYSPAFAITAVFSFITIRDAIGIRMYLGEHARILNRLVGELPAKQKPKFPKHIIERIGHTTMEAVVGALLGLATTLILWLALP
ncbi:MAG: divergent PAP2 family protein [Candidatus Kerfeldbacteria bacterium]|nr:divergent PAP2 family protein [Candidatus Kerfeldbacteria bacterium]